MQLGRGEAISGRVANVLGVKPRIDDPLDWRGLSRDELKEVQRRVADEALFSDESGEVEVVAGVDQAFRDGNAVSCALAMRGDEEVERFTAEAEAPIPYVPGLLAFREMPSALKAVGNLEGEPDALLVDGSGAIHLRFAGLATHLGVVTGIPSVGVTKNLLCGETEEPTAVGEANPVRYEGRHVGYAFLSKERCNPIYVSPGHGFSPDRALRLVRDWLKGHKLPEPIFLADKCVDAAKS